MKIKLSMSVVYVLLILLFLAVGYIVLDKYSDWKQGKNVEIYQLGAQAGYEQAIIQIVDIAVRCDQIPLNINNQTINVIAVDCLNLSRS
tara:strand:- start:15522 stop:15788 length:267 start_codon:yes stop_codon:yes gene_type:complete